MDLSGLLGSLIKKQGVLETTGFFGGANGGLWEGSRQEEIPRTSAASVLVPTVSHSHPHLCRRPSNTSSHVADKVLVLQPGVRPVPLRWESQVKDTGPSETSWPHIISIGESSPRDLHLKAKTQLYSMTNKLQCWTRYAKQLARQEHNPTH